MSKIHILNLLANSRIVNREYHGYTESELQLFGNKGGMKRTLAQLKAMAQEERKKEADYIAPD